MVLRVYYSYLVNGIYINLSYYIGTGEAEERLWGAGRMFRLQRFSTGSDFRLIVQPEVTLFVCQKWSCSL